MPNNVFCWEGKKFFSTSFLSSQDRQKLPDDPLNWAISIFHQKENESIHANVENISIQKLTGKKIIQKQSKAGCQENIWWKSVCLCRAMQRWMIWILLYYLSFLFIYDSRLSIIKNGAYIQFK